MKRIIFIIVITIVLIFTLFVILFRGKREKFGADINQRICEGYNEVVKSEIIGKVNKVFVDEKNHNFKKVLIEDNGKEIVLFLDFDKSGLFEFISKRDSIIKPHNTNIVNVFNEVQYKQFELNYGCVQ